MAHAAILGDLSGVEKLKDTEVRDDGRERSSPAGDTPPVNEAPPATEQFDWNSVSRFKQPEDSLGYLLWQTAHGWMRRLNSEFVLLGITHLQMIALGSTLWLTRIGKPPSQVRLAEFCAMDPMLISKVVRALEKRRAITRTPDPHDTRSKLLTLTDEGRAIILQCIPIVERAYEQFFAPIGEQEPEFHAVLLRLFRSMKLGDAE
jgi:DNA-binding MarR family transcriptional regulator